MEKISIIVPVYNVQNYLPQCLDSILKQTYPFWEVILVDDGSTDNSGKICDSYMKIDSRFKVIHKRNEGAANAKNTGLDYCTGDYITFVDSDDYVDLKWLEKLIEFVYEYNADIIEFNFDEVFKTHIKVVNEYPDKIKEFTANEFLQQYFHYWSNSLFWNKMFKSDLLKDIRFRKERRCIDDEFFTYKVISKAKKIVRTDEVFYHYRQRASSAVTSKKNQQQITEDALEVLIERYEWVCDYFPNLRKIYLQHDINIMFYFTNLNHNQKTIEKFRLIARYYLFQTLKYKNYNRLLLNAIKLQLISRSNLLKEKSNEKNLDIYFD